MLLQKLVQFSLPEHWPKSTKGLVMAKPVLHIASTTTEGLAVVNSASHCKWQSQTRSFPSSDLGEWSGSINVTSILDFCQG